MKRLGNDLYTTADLDLYTAVLGGETITHLLHRISALQDEITALRNRLRFYETSMLSK